MRNGKGCRWQTASRPLFEFTLAFLRVSPPFSFYPKETTHPRVPRPVPFFSFVSWCHRRRHVPSGSGRLPRAPAPLPGATRGSRCPSTLPSALMPGVTIARARRNWSGGKLPLPRETPHLVELHVLAAAFTRPPPPWVRSVQQQPFLCVRVCGRVGGVCRVCLKHHSSWDGGVGERGGGKRDTHHHAQQKHGPPATTTTSYSPCSASAPGFRGFAQTTSPRRRCQCFRSRREGLAQSAAFILVKREALTPEHANRLVGRRPRV